MKMEAEKGLLQCYNRGCGQKFDPKRNYDDSCTHHPGLPFFHDAYKGWSCCNKKCTDFTEFLNVRGCTTTKHSNVKPPEPEKAPAEPLKENEVIEIKPLVARRLQRPPYETEMTTMKPQIAPSLMQQVENNINTTVDKPEEDRSEIKVGTICKNGGCNAAYEGPQTDETACVHHPGVPIFHEGLKFWSCCQKRTSDFNAFLNQVGCEHGTHVWRKEGDDDVQSVQCRWDYHQTGSFVVVAIYAKEFSPTLSVVLLNPIRLYANIVFPRQASASFTLDLELRGIVKVEESNVAMYGTKIEIKLKKAEPGSWVTLDIPRQPPSLKNEERGVGKTEIDNLTPRVDSVDLSDL